MNDLEKKLSKLSIVKTKSIDLSDFIISLRSRQKIESFRKKRFQSGIMGFAFVALISLVASSQLENSSFKYDTINIVDYYQEFKNEGFNSNNIFIEIDEDAFEIFLIKEIVDFDLSELVDFNEFLNNDIDS